MFNPAYRLKKKREKKKKRKLPMICTFVFNSQDAGRTWSNISSRVNDAVFRKNDGLQRNPHDPKWVRAFSVC